MNPARASAPVVPMPTVGITIDGRSCQVRAGSSLLAAALDADLYIPHLCFHPDLGPSHGTRPLPVVYRSGECVADDAGATGEPFAGCGLCAVRVEGTPDPVLACELQVREGLLVRTDTAEVREVRGAALARILASHPHGCLTCAQREGCSREPCSTGLPAGERCCELLGRCELEKLADFVGIPSHTKRYVPRGLPPVDGDPLIRWRPELCVSCLRCVRACDELKGVAALGFGRHRGEVTVGQVAPGRGPAECRYCGACVEVCPTGALTDRPSAGADRVARLVPCRQGCPAGMDIPRFLRALATEGPQAAAQVALDRLPLPASLGRVCFHPCEENCRRGELGGALSVCRLRRQVFESVGEPAAWPAVSTVGQRVAIIGAGPAGLSAAHFLRRLGHTVTVLEAAKEAGGMLRYGIPAYRLPREVLRRDLDRLASEGIEIKTGTALGRDFTLAELRAQGFAAVLLAVGAGAARTLPVAGSEWEGVLLGLDFLRAASDGSLITTRISGRAVLVIGGGNVALDTGRTALRLGAARVTLACLEAVDSMPAFPDELAAARAEGLEIRHSWGVGELLGDHGAVRGARLMRCLSVFDEAGRFAPRLDRDSSLDVAADLVILAIGQEVDPGIAGSRTPALTSGPGGFLQVDEDMTADEAGVFACGDVVLGPSSVIRSVANGARAAAAVDRFLGGSGQTTSMLQPEAPSQWVGREEGFARRLRAVPRELLDSERNGAFAEVELTLPGDEARREASRCLQCDLRLLLSSPALPPSPWLGLEAAVVAVVPATGGVYQLLGADRVATKIAGTPNLRVALEQELAREGRPPYFVYQEDPMYTKRESELIQQFLSRHGHMPAGDSELDDLF